MSNSIEIRKKFINDLLQSNNLQKMISDDNSNIEELTTLKKKIIDFNKIIHNFNGKIMYVKSGSTGHTFKGILDENNAFAIKIVAYSKKGNYGLPSNMTRPENAELRLLKLLSSFVMESRTPHIVLPITTFYSNIESFTGENLRKTLTKAKKYDQFIEKYNDDEYYDYCSILISEWADGGDLLDFIRNHSDKIKTSHWRNIFFQIIATLAIIQDKFPSFRHNDLKANNILLQYIEKDKKEFKYLINGKEYIIPNIGVQIKLWDFDFACIPGIVENQKVDAKWTNKINVTPHKNRYYDLHYFFNTLVKKGFFPELLTSTKIDKSIKDFVLRVIPYQLLKKNRYVSKRGRILVNKEITTPHKLISRDPFFEIYRNFRN